METMTTADRRQQKTTEDGRQQQTEDNGRRKTTADRRQRQTEDNGRMSCGGVCYLVLSPIKGFFTSSLAMLATRLQQSTILGILKLALSHYSSVEVTHVI